MTPPPVDRDKPARARRLAATARARENEREIAQEQAAVKAAQAAVPHDRGTLAAARDERRYVVGDYVHRDTGSKIRLLDTMAPDSPRNGVLPGPGQNGKLLRYAVQCLDHGAGPLYFGTLREAERAMRRSSTWCTDCAALTELPPKVRARNKSLARPRAKM
jgi:hypothetical protein